MKRRFSGFGSLLVSVEGLVELAATPSLELVSFDELPQPDKTAPTPRQTTILTLIDRFQRTDPPLSHAEEMRFRIETGAAPTRRRTADPDTDPS
jgi:hypothetical protein